MFKYIPIEFGPGMGPEQLDEAIEQASLKWKHTLHKYLFDNCHDFVVDILNRVQHKNSAHWINLTLMWHLLFQSTFVNSKRHWASVIPPLCMWTFVLVGVIGLMLVQLYQYHIF